MFFKYGAGGCRIYFQGLGSEIWERCEPPPPKRMRQGLLGDTLIGFGKRGLLEKGSFGKGVFLEILENLEILESPQTLENKRESDHFLEILEIFESLEIPPVKRPLDSRATPRKRKSGCLRVRLEERLGKPMGLDSRSHS